MKNYKKLLNNDLLSSIKENEGFSSIPYKDTQGNITLGFGTKLPITLKEADLLLFVKCHIKLHHCVI